MSAIKGVDYCIVHFDHFLVSIPNIFFFLIMLETADGHTRKHLNTLYIIIYKPNKYEN